MPYETYFAGQEPHDFEINSVVNVTFSTAFALANVRRGAMSIAAGSGRVWTAIAYLLNMATGLRQGMTGTLWTHFMRLTYAGNNGAPGLWEIRNAAGVAYLREFAVDAVTSRVEWWNGAAWVVPAGSSPFVRQTLQANTYDFQLNIAVAGGFKMFVDGIVVSQADFNTSAMADYGSLMFANGNDQHQISDVIVANYNTIGHTVRRRTPSANSAANSAWLGTYLEVDETSIDLADVISSSVVDAAESYDAADMPAIPAGNVIKAVVVSAFIRNDGGAAPQNARAMLRVGATNYEAPANLQAVGMGYVGRQSIWANNPATGAPFVDMAAVNATEFGLIAKA